MDALNRHRGGGRRRPTPTVLQMETTECGAACLAMILAYHGKWVPLEELRVRCGVSRNGTNANNVIKAARKLGLTARGVRAPEQRLFDLPLPMILFWNFNHFVVLEGMRGERVCINDPAEGPRRLSMEEFAAGYSGISLVLEPGPGFVKGGRPPSTVSGLYSRLGHARRPLLFLLLATMLLIVPGLALPTLLKVFVDDVLIPRNGTWMVPLMIGLGLVACLHAVLTWLQQMCLARMEAKIAIVATTRFFMHLFTLPMTFFFQRPAGEISARVTSNDRIAQMLSGELATGAVNALTIAVYGGVMLAYDPVLTAVVFLMVSLNVVALRAVARAREDGSRRLLQEQAKVVGTSVIGLSMIESLRADGSDNSFFSRWTGQHTNAVDAQQSLALLTSLLNVVPPLLSSFTVIAILGVGGIRVLEGVLTIGGLIAFQSLARSFAGPVEQLVRFSANLQTVKGDIGRVDDVLNHEPDTHAYVMEGGVDRAASVPAVPVLGRALRFENVSFRYGVMEPLVLDNFSLEVPPGRRVALVGGSGSGKTTAGQLACRLLTPTSGSVRIGDVDIGDISASRLKSILSYVSQQIVLFDGTVRDNVTLWNPHIEDQEITRALRDSLVLKEVMSRPEKYDSPVGENGCNFSGGQQQLLELARAIVTNPEILVLDEATAALDPISELMLDDNLRRRGITCLIVAHRLSTIRDSDEIVVLEQGRIVERGTHEDLIKADGVYAELVKLE